MNIAIVLLTSLIVFVGIRLFLIFLYWILQKAFKDSTDCMKFEPIISIVFCLMYIQIFLVAVSDVSVNNKLSNAEWYFVYAFIGISLILWCYFNWDMKLKAKPVFGLNEKQIIIKKIFVFALVMIISFVNGYDTMYKEFYGKNVFPEIRVLNATMIVGVIAFDRVLNQVVNYKKLRLQEQAQSREKETK